MAERLTDIEFAAMVLGSMNQAEVVGVCRAILASLNDPFVARELLDASHEIARHADALERSSRAFGAVSGPCRPETAADAVRPTSPGGVGTPPGVFPLNDHSTGAQ